MSRTASDLPSCRSIATEKRFLRKARSTSGEVDCGRAYGLRRDGFELGGHLGKVYFFSPLHSRYGLKSAWPGMRIWNLPNITDPFNS